VHYLLSGWGFLCFAREQRLHRVALFAGAAVWVFSVGTLASNYHPNRLPNFCWIPYFFWLANRLATTARLRDFVGLSVVVGLQLTSGYPEVVLDTCVLVGLMLLLRPLAGVRGQPVWYALALTIGAVSLGAIIASAQTLPLVEVALEARRSSMAELATDAVRNWYRLDRVFWPPAFIALMLLTLSRRSGLLAASDTLLCLFIVGGGWILLRSLPGFSFVRFPFAWALVAQFPFAWSAAVGVDTVLTVDSGSETRKRAVLAFTIFGALCACGYYVYRAVVLPKTLGVPEVIPNYPTAALGLLGSAILALAAARSLRGANAENWLLAATLVLTISHLVAYPFGYPAAAVARPTEHGRVYDLVGSRPRNGRALSVDDVLYGYNLTDRIPSIFGIEESFLPWRYREIIMRVRFLAVFRYIDWNALFTARGLLDAMDLQYVVAAPAQLGLFVSQGLLPIRQVAQDVLYENPERMGKAWVNYAVRVMPSERKLREYVLGHEFDPHVEVVLEQEPKGRYSAHANYLATQADRVTQPSPTELEIDVSLPRPGILVVSESAYPGWQAEVDVQRVDWLRADYILRGIELGPGKHHVRFAYRSFAFFWGLVLSALGIAIALLLGFISVKRKNSELTR
jgi:hypothetical protein